MNGQEAFDRANCPICNSPYGNEFVGQYNNTHIKRCQQINHNISLYARDNSIYKALLILRKTKTVTVVAWLYNDKAVRLQSIPQFSDYQYLEWFEPDFSNYKKLMKKVKTYIAFS